jgi:hypothetical protein
MRARRRLFPWILAALAGCGGAPATPVPDHPPSAQAATAAPPSAFGRPPRALGADAPEAADVSAIVGRYRDELGAKLSVPVGRAEADITPTGEPSNALGQLVADEMLAHLRSMPEHTVDLFVTNDGGLRTPLYGGQILLRHVYEVMPFDNELVVLELDGATVQRILDLVARKGGEPLAGARLVIDPTAGRAHEVTVNARPLDPSARYRLGTTDYLADSGWLHEVVDGLPVTRTGILMRDAIVTRLRERDARGEVLRPVVDDRIRLVSGAAAPEKGNYP